MNRRIATAAKMSRFAWSVLGVGLLSCGLFCQQAQADQLQLTGTVQMKGFVTLSKDQGRSFLVFDSVTTTSASGGFASILNGTSVDFRNFSFNDTTLEIFPPSGTERLALWTITVPSGQFSHFFTWTLGEGLSSTLASGKVTLGPPTWSFIVSGIKGNAGEASSDLFSSGSNSNTTFKLSGTGEAARVAFVGSFTAIPDGGATVALLGVALAGLEGLRRKLRAC